MTISDNLFQVRLKWDGQGFAGDVRASDEQVRRFNASLDEGNRAADRNAASMRLLKGAVGAAVGAFSFQAVKQFGIEVFDAGLRAEKTALILKSVTGSTAAAAVEMDFARSVANRLGLEINSTTLSYAKFLAASRGTALEGEKSRVVFEAIASATAKLGLSSAETEGVLLALQQMISKGTVSAEELRGQLGERLPGAFQVAARSMGVTTAELGKMLEQGQIVATDFLPRFAAELNKTYGSGGPMDTAQASVNRLGNAWEEFKRKLADSGGTAAGKSLLDAMTASLNELSWRFKQEGETWGAYFGRAFAGSAAAQLGAFAQEQRRLAQAGYQAYRAGERAGYEAPAAPSGDAAALAKFVASPGNLSAGQKKLADQTKLLNEFAQAVKGFAQGTPEYERAFAALNQGLANIEQSGQKAAKAAKDLKKEWESYTRRDLDNDLDDVRDRIKAQNEAAKAVAAARREYNQQAQEWASQRDSAREATAALREHNEEIGLEGTALADLRAQRLEAIALEKERQATDLEGLGISEERIQFLRDEVEALRERAELMRSGAAREEGVRGAREAADEYGRIMQSVGDALTDSIMRGFEGGKSFARNFLDSIKNLFKTTVLRLAVQGVVTGVTGAAVNALTGGNANAAGLISGNSGGNGYSSLGTNLAGQGITSAFGGVAGIVSGISSLAAGTTLGSFGAGVAGGLASFGSASATAASIGAAGTGTAAGFGYALGAVAPYLAIIVAVAAALMKGSTPHSGAVVFGGEGGDSVSPRTLAGIDAQFGNPAGPRSPYTGPGLFYETDFTKRYSGDIAKALTPLATGLADSFNAVTRQYGAGSGYRVGLGFSADDDDKSRGRFAVLGADGTVIEEFRKRFSHDPSKGLEQFGLAAQQGILQGLRELDLGREVNAILDKSLSGATDYLTALTQEQTSALLGLLEAGLLDDFVKHVDVANTSFEDLSNRIGQFAKIQGLKPLFDNLGVSIVEFGVDIVAAMGSVENASSAMQSYYTAFYSDAERLGIAQGQLADQFKALNVAMPASKAAFRSLVDGIDLTTASGRQLWAQLLQIAPAFAEVTDAAQQAAQEQIDAQNAAAEAARQAAQQTRDAFRDVAKSLRDFLAGLKTGPYTDLNPQGQYAAAKAAFEATGKRAALGDLTAMQSLQGVASQFLEASKAWFASSAGYSSDLATVQALLERVIGTGTRAGVRGFAGGGVASGLFMAGEAGPELIYSAAPVRVLNAADTRAALDSTPIVAAIDRGTRSNADALARIEARLVRLEGATLETGKELRLINAA